MNDRGLSTAHGSSHNGGPALIQWPLGYNPNNDPYDVRNDDRF